MKELVLKEISKELNWKEKIILKIFTKTIIKVYNITRINTLNRILKD